MQIVISISESFYDRLINMNSDNDTCSFNESALVASIQNGTVLSEHGRLGDLDYLYKKFEANGCKDSNVYRLIKDEPTIIEATKGDNG